jgi:hypothetical protein
MLFLEGNGGFVAQSGDFLPGSNDFVDQTVSLGFCSAQASLISFRRLGPMPSSSSRRADSNELVWKEVRLDDYVLDFNELLGEETPWSVAYAVCYVILPFELKDAQLKIGYDEQAKLYLNSQRVYQHHYGGAYRADAGPWGRGVFRADTDTAKGLELNRGVNVLVFKVVH